jgi:phage shock protein C
MSETQTQGAGIRPFRRSRSNRVLGGVCGGLGEYLGVDPVLFRIGAVVLVFAGGAGILAYAIAWIVVPEADEGSEVDASAREPLSRGRARVIVGAVLICLGGLLLLDIVLPVSIDNRYLWPLLLIVIGVAVIARRERQ